MKGKKYSEDNNNNNNKFEMEDVEDYEDEDNNYNNNNEDNDDYNEEKGPETDDDDNDNRFKQSNIEDEINEAIRKRKEERKQNNLKGDKAFMDTIDEHLGDDFEDTPWVPPSLEVAWEYHLANLYRGGKIPISKIKLTKSTDIGLGVPMYFLFVKILGCTLFLMACLSFPSIIFSFLGNRISSENQDFFSLYRFTIGNIGFDPESSNYIEKSKCTGAPSLICLRIFSQEFSLQSVANILAICEILQVLIFLIGIYLLKSACGRVRGGIGNRTCCVSDFAIRVDDIPSDTTIEQLLQHFSNLYALDKIDWKQRKPLEGATHVSNVYHNGQSIYKGTWIADIVVYGKIGKLIRSFKEKKKNMEELLRYRAMMKMYNHDTSHANGPNPHKYRKAEERMLLAGTKIDEQTKKALSSAKKNAQTTTDHSTTSQIKGLKSDAVVAFITFNYSESMARAVDDYRFYNTFPFSMLTPSQLKFRGCNIKVTHAPEPDEIVWENLEIPASSKLPRRIFSGIVAFFLMVVGFACILQSAKYKRIFDENVPQLSMCQSEIPAVYAGTYDIPSGVEIVRPDIDASKGEKSRSDYDSECGKYIDKSFYAIFTTNGNFNRPLTNYSIIDVCDYPGSKSSNQCPSPGAKEFCPCITTTGSENCDTLSCLSGNGNECPKYKYTTIAGCYCYQELTNLLSGSFLQLINGASEIDFQCENFLTGYLLAISLLLVASLCTVVLNFLLRFFMTALSKREFHETNAEEQRAIVVKIFGTTYINMAFVVLFAYGYLGDKPKILKQASVLDGDYTDFTSDWYANIGPYLTVTFILQAMGPIINNLYKYLIAAPCKRCYAFPQISSMTSNKYVMQADVNSLELGKVFDVTSNTAQLQALLFFAMTYSPGIPLLMPLCAVVFLIYFNVDKLLLLRYYHKPPKMGDAVMRVVLDFLPWACVIRSAIACWMLSNLQLFPDSKLLINKVPSFTYFNSEHISHVYNHWIEHHADKHYFIVNTGHRILRGHVFPIFVLFLLILVPMLIHKFWAYSPFYLIYRTISLLISNVQKLKTHKLRQTVSPFELVASGDELRSEMAPFTGDYFQFLRSELLKKHILTFIVKLYTKLRNDLSAEELEAGWRVSYQGSNKVKMIQWPESVTIGGITRPKGSLKRTYEIISSHGCISYALAKIPHYVKVMAAIQEGVTSVLEDDEEMAKVSIVGTYKKHQHNRQEENDKKVKIKEELWTKKKPKKGNKVVPGNDEKDGRAHDDVKMFSNQESSDEESV